MHQQGAGEPRVRGKRTDAVEAEGNHPVVASDGRKDGVAVEERGEAAEEQAAVDVVRGDAEPAPGSLSRGVRYAIVPVNEERKLLAAAILDQLAEDSLIAELEHLLEDEELEQKDARH